MTVPLSGKNILEGWQKAVNCLMNNKKAVYNLILTIEEPEIVNEAWIQQHDPKKIKNKTKSIMDVANTIFPDKIMQKSSSRLDFYERYKKIHQRSWNPKGWGTYFLRLISFGQKNINQLEVIISKLKDWERNPKGALVFHLSSPETDKPRPRGGPCWQFGELCCNEGKVDFVVVYRNHDYFEKALGNFIALSKLLSFICRESEKIPGKLVCHSVRAYFDETIPDMEKLRNGFQPKII